MKYLIPIVLITLLPFNNINSQSKRSFSVDFNNEVGLIKPLANVTTGPGNSLEGYKDAGIKMIRTNDYYGPCDFPYYTKFFAGDSINPRFDPTNPMHYIWHSTDSILSINYNNGFETFFRLGISFNLAGNSPYYDPPYDYNDTTFNNISEVFKRTVMHYNDRWDNGFNFGIKYWNVWTEPDGGFWNQDLPPETYYRMYTKVSRELKEYDADLKIGGPGLLSGSVVSGREWVPDFINYCKENNAVLDFLSWHLYRQYNPYAVHVYSEYIRNLLDEAGFENAESVITETNMDLGSGNNANVNLPKGAAWFASMLIAAQNSPLDRLIMYRGDKFMNLLNDDENGEPSYTYSGLGFKAFATLADESPIQIDAQGSVFISDEITLPRDTTNLMILASKTEANDACYILISNFNSQYDSYEINITNLPWSENDSLKITKYFTDVDNRWDETSESLIGGSDLTLNIDNVNDPSVLLLKIKKMITTGVEAETFPTEFLLAQNYPNPFFKESGGNPTTIIEYSIPVGDAKFASATNVVLKVFDVLGREIATLVNKEQTPGSYKVHFSADKLTSGIYFYRLQAGNFVQTRKMLLVK